MPDFNQVRNVLGQLHDSGVLNLDKSIRETIAPGDAIGALNPGGEAATAVVAWDGYGVVVKSNVAQEAQLANVAGQLGNVTRGAGGGGG